MIDPVSSRIAMWEDNAFKAALAKHSVAHRRFWYSLGIQSSIVIRFFARTDFMDKACSL